MKGVTVIYHDINKEARSQEILSCAEMLCSSSYYVSYAGPKYSCKSKIIKSNEGRLRYLYFLSTAIRTIKKIKPDVLILHDNLTAPILGWLKKKRMQCIVVYDSSELYIDWKPQNLKTFVAGFINVCEKKYLRYADVVLAANVERADIMQEYFHLKEKPHIFDNIHRIDDDVDMASFDEKYEGVLGGSSFVVIYAGGIAKGRRTYDIVKAVGELGDEFGLLIFGRAEKGEQRRIDEYIKENNIDTIRYMGVVSRAELKYVFQRSAISVSVFLQNTVNNINCASGKTYESIFEGTPVLTSENPPLKRLCVEHGVGVSNDDFKEGIIELYRNYEFYKRNTINYAQSINYEERVSDLANYLKHKLAEGI